ncbi:MAG: protein phosphatase CheZ [Deltaproteobacteria bacterium]|nr:protein phosphatase CheZ [Deltaproteobacteria bacterium]MBW1919664.1 protein phosphatase CheZ [Deltaproteobacteria bacterium]MBW1934016.1 protein phosphatase CheZ [Deltaproteobacteria bacterium]MBW1976411.1 protein phosphatase CheZ [Deltaproteobacteria bacterium]MBW2043311.1 protein phosphatase CheZ [Deltaproteobacteria bacterium]
MKEDLTEEITRIVNGKLTKKEINELMNFIGQAISSNLCSERDGFFKNLAYEMTGQVKELALMIIDFRKELRSKIHPHLTEIATKYAPQTADQLQTIIEATETAANKIMDNLEAMQEGTEAIKKSLTSLKQEAFVMPGGTEKIHGHVLSAISPFINSIESTMEDFSSRISDSFVQMSFQDLTGQRIKRVIDLMSQTEEKIKRMVISFGIKLTEREKNPNITSDELEKAVEQKVVELAGPQKEGEGLDQEDIDALLASI